MDYSNHGMCQICEIQGQSEFDGDGNLHANKMLKIGGSVISLPVSSGGRRAIKLTEGSRE
jgi:hypothetical protein